MEETLEDCINDKAEEQISSDYFSPFWWRIETGQACQLYELIYTNIFQANYCTNTSLSGKLFYENLDSKSCIIMENVNSIKTNLTRKNVRSE